MAVKWKTLTFKTMKEAQDLRRALWKLLDEQEAVSLYDICLLAKKSGNKELDKRHVWYDFGAIYVTKEENGKFKVNIQAEPFFKNELF